MPSRPLVFILVAAALTGWLTLRPSPREIAAPDSCAGPPLRSVKARNDALEAGYAIDPRYDCIDRESFEAVNAERRAWEERREASVTQERQEMRRAGDAALEVARHGFTSAITLRDPAPLPLPQPPAELFVRSDYRNPQNYMLAGYVTPDPGDGRRRPAIIWLTGGDTNSLGDFWTPGTATRDESARALREAGIVMMFPTLRGGNGQAEGRELLLGEVEDVLAAARQLARLSYVDPSRIYLGGHSTGGTLALLVAEMPNPFRAVFALGPVARADRYPGSLFPVDFGTRDAMELKLRSPIHWLDDIAQPTYVLEGTVAPANRRDFDALCAGSPNVRLRCLDVRGADHFGTVRRVTEALAPRLMLPGEAADRPFTAEDFAL